VDFCRVDGRCCRVALGEGWCPRGGGGENLMGEREVLYRDCVVLGGLGNETHEMLNSIMVILIK
jgi:hypothetical protein